MAIDKHIFNQYTKERESIQPSKDIDKKVYSHNKPFTNINNDSPNESVTNNTTDNDLLISINPNLVVNWEFHDRPEFELGDIQALANDFIKVGQQQPCVVRPVTSNSKHMYELIIGERRWRASKLAGINLKVIVKNGLTDVDAALAQAAENDNRIDLSDYAKGMSYSKLINNRIIKQKDLIERLGKSKQYVSALLSYSKIPNEIISAIGDMSQVKYYSAEKIKQLSSKGELYITALISIGKRISSKSLSANAIEKEIDLIIYNSKKSSSVINNKIITNDGRHLFTWRNDNNNLPSLHFPKQIVSLFTDEKINIKDLTSEFIRVIENKISTIK
ncbi:MAG: ParB family chromosome partitioning protein [Francisellaceae bacterium]|jgi:ParB family chromosome partitioning protein